MSKIRINIFINILVGLIFLSHFAETSVSAFESNSKGWEAEGLLFLSLEEILNVPVVTASKKEEESFYAPGTVYVITEEEIKRYGWRFLQDALKYVPSVYLYDPHSWVWGGQRGFVSNFSQTLLMINGREVNNLIASEGFISRQFATHNIKRIEVLASPGSALYGANALAGVINIITKEVDPSYEGVEVSVDYGSFNSRGASIVFGQKIKDWKISGSAMLYKSDEEDYTSFVRDTENYSRGWSDNNLTSKYDNFGDYENPSEGRPLNLQIDYRDIYFGFNHYYNRQSHGLEKLRWDYTNGEDHRDFTLIYGGINKEITYDKKIKVEFQRVKSKMWGQYHAGREPKIGAQTPDYITLNPACGAGASYADCLFGASAEITDADIAKYFNHIYTNKDSRGSIRQKLEVQLDWDINDRTGLITGFMYDSIDYAGLAVTDSGTGVGATYDIPIDESKKQRFFDSSKYGVFAQLKRELKVDSLWLTAGMRHDHQNHYGGTTNPRVGLVWQQSRKRIIKFMYGEAFREPTPFELDSTNPDPAKLRSYEVNYSQLLGDNARFFLAGYHNTVTDFLNSVSSWGGNVGQVEEQQVVGAEFRLDIKHDRWLSFINGSFILDAEQKGATGQQELVNVPEERVNVGVTYNIVSNYDVSLLYSYVGSYGALSGDPATGQFKIKSSDEINTTLSVRDIDLYDLKWEGFLTVTNLTDSKIYHANIRGPGPHKFLQDGRAVYLRIVTKW